MISFILAKFFFFLNINLSETIALSLQTFGVELKQKEYIQHPRIRVSGETEKCLEVMGSTLMKQIFFFCNFRAIQEFFKAGSRS